MFDVLCRRKHINDRRELTSAGLIAATLINVNRPKNKKAVKIEDVIGKDGSQEPKRIELSAWMSRFAKK